MSSDRDDNDNEQKNIETYKVMGDQMARLALNYTNKDKTDENSFLITYNDLEGKTQQINPSLKTGEQKNNNNKGKVKFSQGINSSPSNKIETKQSQTHDIKSSKNSFKPNLDNSMNESDKNLPIVDNNRNNPSPKNSAQNYMNPNSIANANTNTNTSRDKTNFNNNNIPKKNSTNNLNTIDSCSNKNINSIPISKTNSNNNYKQNNLVITNGNQTNFSANANIKPKSSKKVNNNSNQIKPTNTNQSKQTINFNNTINNSNNQSSINNNANGTLNSEDLDPIEIETVNDNIEDESNNSSINPFVLNTKVINKGRQYTLYEREMKNLNKKKMRLDKERNLIIQKKLNELQDGPKINETSHNLLTNRGEYIPIHQRAAQLHSRHLTQIILHEQLKRMEKEREEEKELEMIRSYRKKAKKYDKEKWNSFVDSCNKWNEEVKYKRKAAEIFRNNMEKKVNYKPRINPRSKKIMRKIQKGNKSVDDVFTRLYNDYDEHKERQKILEDENLPPFSPKINTYRRFKKNINRKSTNNSLDNFVVNDRDNNFFLESQLKIAGEKNKIKKDKTRKIKNPDKFVNKKNNNNNNKIKNNIKNTKNNIIKNKKFEKPKENRSYKPTMATNNSTIPVNTEGNTLGFSNRYITNENPLITTETNQYYIPTAANNYFSDEKGDEITDNSIQNPINNYFGSINEEEEVIPNNKNKFFDDINKDNRIVYPSIDAFNNNNNYKKLNKNKSKSVEKNDNLKNNNTFFDNIYEDNRIEDDNNNYFYNNRLNNNNIRYQYGPKNNYPNNNKSKNNFNKKYNNNNNKHFYNNKKPPNEIINNQDPFYIFDNTNNNDNTNGNNNYFEKDNNCVNDQYFKNLYAPVKSIDRNNGINENNDENDEENEDDENENENDNEDEKNDDGNENQKWDINRSNMNYCIGNDEMFKEAELIKELDKAQMDSKERQANNQGDKNDSLYRLNIMDATPENGRENVILTTNKYQNFFDIEGINEL